MKATHLILATATIISIIIASSEYISFKVSEHALRESIIQANNTFSENAVQRLSQRLKLRIEQLQMLSLDEPLHEALHASNKEFENNTISNLITERDAQWVIGKNQEFVSHLLENPASRHFKQLQTSQQTTIAEIFATNKFGAVFALSAKTTDYKQDDEIWWQETMRTGTYLGGTTYDL